MEKPLKVTITYFKNEFAVHYHDDDGYLQKETYEFRKDYHNLDTTIDLLWFILDRFKLKSKRSM